MKKAFVSLLAVVLSFSIIVRAEEDLPDPGAGSSASTNPGSLPPPPPAPPTAPSAPSAPVSDLGSVRIQNVSRASGGTVYHIQVSPATSLQRVVVRVNGGKVVIGDARVNTTNSQSIFMRNLVSPDILTAGARMGSESLNQSDRVRSIDLNLEAYGGSADVTVAVVTDREVPSLSLQGTVAPQPPTSPAPPSPVDSSNGRFSVGSRVMDSEEYVGTVVEIYSNGKTKVRFDGYSSADFRDARDLAVAVKCLRNQICASTRVMDSNEYVGVVGEVFSNGKARVRFDGYTGFDIRSANDLGFAVRCIQSICASVRVLDSNEYAGVVGEVFSNGKARVRFDGYSGFDVRSVNDLGVAVNCLRGICEGRRVMDSNDYAGVVGEVFSNGKVRVRFDGYSGFDVRAVSDLGGNVSCAGGICISDRVIDSNNYLGTVVEIFSNRKARVRFDGYSGADVRAISDLSKKLR